MSKFGFGVLERYGFENDAAGNLLCSGWIFVEKISLRLPANSPDYQTMVLQSANHDFLMWGSEKLKAMLKNTKAGTIQITKLEWICQPI